MRFDVRGGPGTGHASRAPRHSVERSEAPVVGDIATVGTVRGL